MEDIRIRIIAEAITKDAETAIKRQIDLEKELKSEVEALSIAQKNAANSNTQSTNQQIGIIKNLQEEIKRLTELRTNSNSNTEIASYTRQIQAQQNELNKLTTVQKDLNQQKEKATVLTKEQNAQIQALTGNAEKSNGMFKNLALTLGAMFAADKIIDYSKSLFDATIQAERQNIALKNISATNAEYADSIGFLNEITNKYGQNINSVRESYVGFIAASKSSNLALGERQKIYESVIQAGSTLQLSNEKMERSLNAVSQMFSKGNVSAEELRQQLGESLPGAFGIMAKALNVNEKQLNKMLEQGEVLAKDALPKFAAALTELYGDKAQSNVNTWAGGLNRATNSIIAWSQKTNESIGLTKKMAEGANWLADNLNTVINAIIAMSAAIAVNTIRTIANNTVKQIQLINLGREVLAKQAASVVTLELTAAETAAAAAATRFNAAIAAAPWGLALVAITAVVGALLEYNDAQNAIKEQQNQLNKSVAEALTPLRQQQIEFNNLSQEVLKGNLTREDQLKLFQKLKEEHPILLKDTKNLQEAEKILNENKIKTNSQYDYRSAKLDELKSKFPTQLEGINNLKDAERKLGIVIRDTNLDFITRAKLLENEVKLNYNNQLATKAITEQIELENRLKNASKSKTTMVTGTAGLAYTYDSEAESIQKLIDSKKKLVVETQKNNAAIAKSSEDLNKKLKYDYSEDDKNKETSLNKQVGDTKKAEKEKEAAIKKTLKESEKAHNDTIKAIEKSNDEAEKNIRKGLENYMKSKIASNKAETDANEKLQKELMDNALKMALFQDSIMKLERIKKAKTLEEIEKIESEYTDKALKRELEYSKIWLAGKEKQFKDLKALGALTKEEEDKRAKELLELRQVVADKELAITKKEITDKQKQLKDDKDFVDELWKKEVDDYKKKEEAKSDIIKKIKADLVTELPRFLNELMEKEIEVYQKQVDAATNATDKFMAEQKLKQAKNTQDITSGMVSILSGDYVKGAMKLITGLVKYFDNEVNAFKNGIAAMEKAQLERTKSNLDAMLPKIQAVIDGLTDIKDIYISKGEEPFKDVVNSLSKLNSIYSEILTKANSFNSLTGRDAMSGLEKVDAEIELGKQIIANFNLAVEKENSLFKDKYDNQVVINNQRIKDAEIQYNNDISDINSKFDLEIKRINDKYDYIAIKNSQKFDSESLAISESTNADLMAFVNNEDLKLKLNTGYEDAKAKIKERFALSYKPITEGMSQAEIDGINASIKARDEAFAKLATWQTSQITFVIENGQLERDTFTDTQKIIADGKEATYQLGLKYQAIEIQDNIDKGIEIEKAEIEKDAATLKRKSAFDKEMQTLDQINKVALETIEAEHNNVMVQLEESKNAAIKASMDRLKEDMKSAIQEMTDKYSYMVQKGIEGSAELLTSLNALKEAYKNLYNESLNLPTRGGDNNTPTNTDTSIPKNTPRFNLGTEQVGGKKGVDKNLAWLSYEEGVMKGELNQKRLDAGINMSKTVEYAINYKNMLSDSNFVPLELKPNLIQKLDERAAMQYLLNMNMGPVVDELQSVKLALSKLPIQNFTLDENGLKKFVKKGNSVQEFKSKMFD